VAEPAGHPALPGPAGPASGWRTDEDADPALCARILAEAFAREPAVTWIAGGSAAVRLRWFTATVRTQAAIPGTRCLTLAGADGRPVGAAVLTPPHAVPPPAAQARWAADVLARCGPRAFARTLRHLRATAADKPRSAWTLEFVGTVPAAAGRGAGRQLLAAVLAGRPGADGIALTTADPETASWYGRLGFATLREPVLGPLRITVMHRPPGGPPS
jgi:hypothetical protein